MPLENNCKFPQKKYIIDANINRFKEGARVLEDLSRFILKDERLFIKIRTLRHKTSLPFICRSMSKDIGGLPLKENNNRNSLLDLAHANAIRMQEAARVLEEIYSSSYKEIRFRSYEVHDDIIIAIKKFIHFEQLNGVYVICDLDLMSAKQISKTINNSNVSLCQIRCKKKNKKDLLAIVIKLREEIKKEVLLIVNDHLDVALAAADGVHLGQSDFPLYDARRLCPENFIVGISCHNINQANSAQKDGANYVSVGCIFHTTTKNDTIPVSISTLKNIARSIQLPVCAIGGVNYNNINELSTCRISMIASFSSIWNSDFPADEITNLSKIFNKF